MQKIQNTPKISSLMMIREVISIQSWNQTKSKCSLSEGTSVSDCYRTTQAWIQSQRSLCGIWGRQNGSGVGSSTITLASHVVHDSTNAPFFHLYSGAGTMGPLAT
jgi:hypothetical protein